MADADNTQRGADTDDDGLPVPSAPELDTFTVWDYLSDEYADAKTLDEAIEIRGRKAFFDKVEPGDFGEDGLPSARRIGIAELWSQSTWSAAEVGGRNVASERSVAAVSEGDVLTVLGVPASLPAEENWTEVAEAGFGFYLGDELLPFTPYHDYDHALFLDAIGALHPGERIECVVRKSACYGGDGVAHDPDFSWRVYSCEVTVLVVSGQ